MLQEKPKKKWEPPAPPPRVGRRERKRHQGGGLGTKLPTVTPNAKCKLRLLKMERIKDWLLLEEEFVTNQQRLKPQEERAEEDRSKVCKACRDGLQDCRQAGASTGTSRSTSAEQARGCPGLAGHGNDVRNLGRIMRPCPFAGGRDEGLSHDCGLSGRDHR